MSALPSRPGTSFRRPNQRTPFGRRPRSCTWQRRFRPLRAVPNDHAAQIGRCPACSCQGRQEPIEALLGVHAPNRQGNGRAVRAPSGCARPCPGVEILEIDDIIQDKDRIGADSKLIHSTPRGPRIGDDRRREPQQRPGPSTRSFPLAVQVVSHAPNGQGTGQPATQARIQIAKEVRGLHDMRFEPPELRGERRKTQRYVGEPDVAESAEPTGL